jgi:SAM-dependent methyltransferase
VFGSAVVELMLSTDKAWEKLGKRDPYFGVLADDKFSTGKIIENRDEFFHTGQQSVAHTLHRYEAHFGALPRRSALDHGCGVGRLTLPLAREFEKVVALDVSPSMISEAKANADRFSVTNADFSLADDKLSNAVGQSDFVNSYMVLQHIPVRRGLQIVSRLIDRVAPGGGFHIHFSQRSDGLASRSLWWASHHIPGVKIWQNIRAGRAWNAPGMQMNNYPLNKIALILTDHGIKESALLTEQHGKFLTCGLIGRKPERA